MDNFTLNYKTNLTNVLRNLEDKKIKYLLLFCYFFSFNSFYFLSGPILSVIFFIKASFVFTCKFLILSLGKLSKIKT